MKIPFIRIHGCIPMKFEDGTVGSHLLVDSEDMAEIPLKMIAWDASCKIDDLPKKWKNKDGIAYKFEGHHAPLVGNDIPRLIHICIEGLRIYRVCRTKFDDGGYGTTIQANSDDITKFTKDHPTFSTWDSTQNIAEMPREWEGKIVYSANHLKRADNRFVLSNAIIEEKIQ